MPKAFLVKKFKRSKWTAHEPKLGSKRLREIQRNHGDDYRCKPLFEIKKKTSSVFETKVDETHLVFFTENPLLNIPHTTATDQTCLNLKNQPRSRKEEGKKPRKVEAKKSRSYAQNVNRPLIVPNEKFEFPKPNGPLPQTQYICQLCKEVYPDPFALAQHRCSGIKHTEYRCPECDKVFSCPANLASHRRWHRPRSPSSHVAKKASAALTDAAVMADARKKADGSPDSKSFSATAIPDAFNGNPEYVCELCDKTFRRKTYLQKHMNSHSNDRPYPCQYCGKVFRSLTNRAKHVLNHAVGSNMFACEVCGNGFPNRASLEKHSRVHNSEVFACSNCSSTFYSAPGLARHSTKCHNSNALNRQDVLLEVPGAQG